MDRKKQGLMFVIVGSIVFVVSLFFLLPVPEFYLASLLLLFISVVLIGTGGAMYKGIDGKIDETSDDCYYCSGTGLVEDAGEKITCPRCGGTGLARVEDQ